MKATIEQVHEVIRKAEITTRDPAGFDPEIPLTKQGVDSLDMATLVFHLEDHFDIRISHTRYKDLKSISDIVAFVNSL